MGTLAAQILEEKIRQLVTNHLFLFSASALSETAIHQLIKNSKGPSSLNIRI